MTHTHQLALLDAFDPTVPLEAALMPPANWYLTPELLSWERAGVFERSWLPLARADQVRLPGSYVAGEVVGNPYLIVRGSDGVLRGLHNVCRHHNAEVLHGTGCRRELRCGYHGWTYELDGRLRRAPRIGQLADFDAVDYSLIAFEVREWGPLVFGVLSEADPDRDLATDLAPVAAVAGRQLRWIEHRDYELRCNWKVFVENSLDGGYHVPFIHRSLARGLSFDQYETTLYERTCVQRCSARDDERLGNGVSYAWLFPNLFLNRYGNVLDTNVVLPLAPDRCLVRFDWYVEVGDPDAEIDPMWTKQIVEASDEIQREDILVCESVQRGLGSCAARRGRYSAELEGAVHAFHVLMHAVGTA